MYTGNHFRSSKNGEFSMTLYEFSVVFLSEHDSSPRQSSIGVFGLLQVVDRMSGH